MHAILKTKSLVIASLVVIFVLLIVFNTTKPGEIGAGGILIVFGMLYILSFLLTLLLLRFVFRLQMDDLSNSSQFILVATVAGVPIIALALHTLEQLFFRDFIILVGLTGITIFYWLKRG